MSVITRSTATREQLEIHEMRSAAIARAQARNLGNLRLTSAFDGRVRLHFERGTEEYWLPNNNNKGKT